jgi:hypothetical protein
MKHPFTVALMTFAALTIVASLGANAQTFVSGFIDARSAIFNADPANSVTALNPLMFSLTPGSGRILTFSSVTGDTKSQGDPGQPYAGPDGQYWFTNGVHITSLGSISGVIDDVGDSQMSLVGVFTADTISGPAPVRQNYTGSVKNQASYTPLLNQTFFIGDGLTGTYVGDAATGHGSGVPQLFYVPTGATRLYLGFADAPTFNGSPGSYMDNLRGLNATFTVAPAGVPEPGVSAIFGIGVMALAGFALRSRRALKP